MGSIHKELIVVDVEATDCSDIWEILILRFLLNYCL